MLFRTFKTRVAVSVPLHKQVRDLLADRISAGEWNPGHLLPNESKLAEEFGVSIGTVRRAVEALEEIGIVARKQGRGTFVTAPDIPSALEESLCRIRSPDGTAIQLVRQHVHTTRRPPLPAEARCFKWADEGQLIEVASVLLSGRQPIGAERSIVPACILTDADDASAVDLDIYAALRRRGVRISRSDETVSVVTAEPAEVEALRLSAPSPVLQVQRIAYISADEAVEIRVTSYRPEPVVYSTRLG